MARRDAVHKQISSRRAPKPVGPYVQAVRVESPGATLLVSGQIPIELPSGKVFTGDIRKQAELALTHLKNIVLDADFTMDEVVKCTIYLTNMDDFDTVNQVYQTFFTGRALPARALVEVSRLPKDVNIEVECMAMKQSASSDNLFMGMR
ncbi:MAG: Rid family detoxifying hydrolase [Myxococcota bacterium]|nr:Rid family detoxifying hydrolase [Myxococcota bacterium]